MSRRALLIGLGTITGTVAACGQLIGPTCSAEAKPAIVVEVRDSLTNAAAGNGARVIARDGAFADTAGTFAPLEGPVLLALEREGTYTVTVEREGYRLWTRTGVRVTADECHVRTVSLTARLQR